MTLCGRLKYLSNKNIMVPYNYSNKNHIYLDSLNIVNEILASISPISKELSSLNQKSFDEDKE